MEKSHDDIPEWDENGPAPGSHAARQEVREEVIGSSDNLNSDGKKNNGASDRRSFWNIVIISTVLILMLLGIVLVPKWLGENKFENDKYNNFEFIEDSDGFWNTVVNKNGQPYALTFYYHPREVENVIVEQNIRNKFFDMQAKNGTIFISVDPNQGDNKVVVAGVEISKITGTRFGLLNVNTKSGFLKAPVGATTNTNTPVVSCEDANNKTMVVAIAVTNKNLVSSRENCIILEAASSNESVMVADRLMYHLLGIME